VAQNFHNITGLNGETIQPFEAAVDAGAAATIEKGMSVTKAANRYVAESADSDNSAVLIYGLAANTSDETATVDGTVLVYRAPVLRAIVDATTPANLATTTTLILCTLDVTGTTHTVDENETTLGFIILESYDNTTDGNCTVQFPCRFVVWT